ncbi:sensor histidine kinase [Oxynema aestuarii]|uniref:histidine kinase n=1 Tax=Oxynema aestuarii AP17 TaxID=2064643 RepID=A0A6H1TXF5_9CYAN|nr:ATP-binding protein [Oxynema aestuarii]QIZ70453.1 response regulator [Oxynema aestuarii AP17]RMH75888.1 MAG: response regulator [Cyanobacteria bacterium J007]
MTEPVSERPTILIVDDTPDNLRLLSAMLSDRGYEVRKAINGRMALIAVEAAHPDLILLDIMMPEMDGYEVCTQLKSSPKTEEIPVIFLSALNEINDKVKAFTVGGADYISKPFHEREVLIRVENRLMLRRLQKQLSEQNTKLLEQNERLNQLNAELERSNQELEQFAYVVSHDLQSPLQSIIGFVDLLAYKYKNKLDEKANRYIYFIEDGAKRMQQLIQGLLAYSRVGRKGGEFEAVDCTAIVDAVKHNLSASIAASQAEVICHPLPEAIADPLQLSQVFQNLIGNAIKFCRSEEPPKVDISAERKDDQWLFKVSDNGIGIEAEYFQRIFEIFQRLHTAEEYPGTGIGMAICKKIVERHGGQIWVESTVNVGTTFYFTLPCDRP